MNTRSLVSRRVVAAVALAAVAVPVAALDPRLERVNDWLYALQNASVSPASIAASQFDLVVMDYSSDGSAGGEFAAGQIEAIKASGKTALCYLSIGEAETYRFYWNPAWNDQPAPDPDSPAWLGPFNPLFPDNYKVRYWDAAWQAILFGTSSGPDRSYLDRIIDQGFDGIYLDIIDGYEFWSEEMPERTRLQARTDMRDLVGALRTYARDVRGRPGFLVFPQNGGGMVLDDAGQLDELGRSFLAHVDGIGAEDTYYGALDPRPIDETDRTRALLEVFRSGGGATRLVLAVDYVWDAEDPAGAGNVARVNDFAGRSIADGFVPYAAVSDLSLDEILTFSASDGLLFEQPRVDPPIPSSLVVK